MIEADISKAMRWFNDTLRWTEPDSIMNPTPEQLEEFLAQPAPFWVYDVETDGI